MRVLILVALLLGAQDKRAAVPSDADQKAAEKSVRELFKEDYRGKDPVSRRMLADKLLAKAADARDDAATRHALLKESRDVALQAQDWGLALRASDELIRSFIVEGGPLRMGVLDRMIKVPPDSPATAKVMTDLCLAAADQFIASDDYDRASRALQLAEGPARVSKETVFPILARGKAAEIGLIKTEYSKVRPAEKAFLENLDDAAAALALGKFFCLAKRDWTRGLPLLARGSDAKLKSLAGQELAPPGDATAELAVGNGWWGVAEEQQNPLVRQGVRDHALQWLARAWGAIDPSLKAPIREKMKATWAKPGAKAPSAKAVSSVPAPWGLMGTIPTTLEETPAHLGSYSIRVGGLSSPKLPARPGDMYQVSGWVLSDGNEGAGDCFRVDFFSSDGKFIGAEGPDVPVDLPMWVFVSRKVTCPAQTTSIMFASFRSKSIGSFWVDDVSLRKDGEDRELVRNGSFEDK